MFFLQALLVLQESKKRFDLSSRLINRRESEVRFDFEGWILNLMFMLDYD